MTNGASQGLFVIVAVVIFGIFIAISYLLFGDKMKTGLASVFTDSLVQAQDNLGEQNNNNNNNGGNETENIFEDLEKVEFDYAQYFIIYNQNQSINISSKVTENMRANQYFEITKVPNGFKIKDNLEYSENEYMDSSNTKVNFKIIVKNSKIYLINVSPDTMDYEFSFGEFVDNI